MGWWRNLSNFGLEPNAERGLVRRAQMTNRMIFISICVGFSYVPMYLSIGSYEPLIQNLVLTVFTALLFLLSARGKHEIAAVLLCCLLLVHIISVSLIIQGGTARFYLIEISILGFTMIRRVGVSIVIFIVSFGAFFLAEFAHLFIEPVIRRSADDNMLVYSVNIGLIFLGGLYLIFHLKRTNDYFERDVLQQKKLIEQQHVLLQQSHREITDSITYAKRIQSAILPQARIVKESLQNSFIIYTPKDIVAGDFYWFESLSGVDGSKVRQMILFAACDCTGHGVPGAMVSVICNNALNRSVREYGLTDPGKILDKTREIVIGEFEKSDDDVRDGMDLALVALHLDHNGELVHLQFAGANNPLWLIRDGKLQEFRGDKQPIGAYAITQPFTMHDVPLLKGDTLYLFSDGYADQFGGANPQKPMGKKFGGKKLQDLLLEINHNDLQTCQEKIIGNFEKWQGDLEQLDDVCVIGVRV